MTVSKSILLFLLFSCYNLQDVEASSYEKSLIRRLTTPPTLRYVRPVRDPKDALEVKFGLSLQNIVKLNEKDRTVTIVAWQNMEWRSHYLTWQESQYGNVTTVLLPTDQLWMPDIMLYNSFDPSRPLYHETSKVAVVVYSSGKASYVQPFASTVRCKTTDEDEVLACTFKFGSWHHDGTKINMTLIRDSWDTSTFDDSGLFRVFNHSVARSVVRYECCPEPYIDATFRFNIQRM